MYVVSRSLPTVNAYVFKPPTTMFLKHDLHTPLTQNMYFPENVNVPIATLSREFHRNLYLSHCLTLAEMFLLKMVILVFLKIDFSLLEREVSLFKNRFGRYLKEMNICPRTSKKMIKSFSLRKLLKPKLNVFDWKLKFCLLITTDKNNHRRVLFSRKYLPQNTKAIKFYLSIDPPSNLSI